MSFNKDDVAKKAIFNKWFTREFLLAWLTFIVSFLIIRPFLKGGKTYLEFDIWVLVIILFLLVAFLPLALFHAFLATRKHTIKSEDLSLRKNLNKSLSIVSGYIVLGYFFLSEQLNYFGSDLHYPDADLIGRKFRFDNSYTDGKIFFYTIVAGSLFYLLISAIQLYRIKKNNV